MNTFLPSISFEQSAKWLDSKRLGKQRVECLQILKALTNPDYGWQKHPAVRMWRGYEHALVRYGLGICEEWCKRGYEDTCYQKVVNLFNGIISFQESPPWLTEEFASNHRSILLGKVQEAVINAQFLYGQATWDKADNRKAKEEKVNIEVATKKLKRAEVILEWYQQFNWLEQPAQRVNGKWLYLWPEVS